MILKNAHNSKLNCFSRKALVAVRNLVSRFRGEKPNKFHWKLIGSKILTKWTPVLTFFLVIAIKLNGGCVI